MIKLILSWIRASFETPTTSKKRYDRWTSGEVLMFNKYSDHEISLATGRSLSSIQSKRRRITL